MNDTKSTVSARTLKVSIPSHLPAIEELAAETGLVPDKLRAILHQLFLSWLKMKRIEKNKGFKEQHRRADFFPVSAELLKDVASENYASYVRFLEEKEVVERMRRWRGPWAMRRAALSLVA